MQQALFRIIDANYNRAKEALRVAEDIARFYFEDPRLTTQFKKTRHDLTQSLLGLGLSYRSLVEARDSAKDVGARSLIHDKKNPNWKDLFISNLKRGQEAARVLEELSKMARPQKTKSFQKIRFRLYELEKVGLKKF